MAARRDGRIGVWFPRRRMVRSGSLLDAIDRERSGYRDRLEPVRDGARPQAVPKACIALGLAEVIESAGAAGRDVVCARAGEHPA